MIFWERTVKMLWAKRAIKFSREVLYSCTYVAPELTELLLLLPLLLLLTLFVCLSSTSGVYVGTYLGTYYVVHIMPTY